MAIDHNFLLVIKSAGIGDSQPDLGETLMGLFLNQLLATDKLPAQIACVNTAVFLTTEGSKLAGTLRQFEQAGTEVLSCGTCLKYFDREEKLIVGKPTTMKETVRAMVKFDKVITL